ncbi:MAG: hypothetical protein JNN10_07930 [Sphingopyxis sp.]|uniref:hypothetical protein n=1 Tax=Sphingopyxis sp. TaxID=1908224 RepID=UPI001A37CCB4|nr:hypothetical protein [Sphingopyxis sp.]MBL9066207.1 hypothetical protein [Sphingopyxis sp.]
MQNRVGPAVAAIALMLASQPAFACRMANERNLPDIHLADLVVVGRISNYEIVRDSGYYATFAVEVEEVVKGNAEQRLTVRWDNSTFALPNEMGQRQFLIALRAQRSEISASATTPKKPHDGRELMTVLQAPCSGAFILRIPSEEARIARDILSFQTK